MKTGTLGATPQATLVAAQAQLAAAQLLWNQISASVASIGAGSPCQYYGSPAGAPQLQQISQMCCTIAHQAAVAALGFAVQCGSAAAASHANNAEQATTAACTMSYECTFGEVAGDAPGTVTLDVNGQGVSCLDRTYRNCVGAQLQAAQTAVYEAQAAQAACAVATPPVVAPPVFIPRGGFPILRPPVAPPSPIFRPQPILRAGFGAPASHPGVANPIGSADLALQTMTQQMTAAAGVLAAASAVGSGYGSAVAAYQAIGKYGTGTLAPLIAASSSAPAVASLLGQAGVIATPLSAINTTNAIPGPVQPNLPATAADAQNAQSLASQMLALYTQAYAAAGGTAASATTAPAASVGTTAAPSSSGTTTAFVLLGLGAAVLAGYGIYEYRHTHPTTARRAPRNTRR